METFIVIFPKLLFTFSSMTKIVRPLKQPTCTRLTGADSTSSLSCFDFAALPRLCLRAKDFQRCMEICHSNINLDKAKRPCHHLITSPSNAFYDTWILATPCQQYNQRTTATPAPWPSRTARPGPIGSQPRPVMQNGALVA